MCRSCQQVTRDLQCVDAAVVYPRLAQRAPDLRVGWRLWLALAILDLVEQLRVFGALLYVALAKCWVGSV